LGKNPQIHHIQFYSMKKYFLFFILSLSTLAIYAQMYYDEGRLVYAGDSTVEGSYMALGINPANLGRTSRFKTGGGLLQVGGNFHSNGLNLGQVLNLSFTDQLLSDTVKNLLVGQNSEPSEAFEYDGNLDINWVSYSWAKPKVGGFAINIQDRIASTATIPNSFFGILLKGTDAPAVDSISSLNDLYSLGDGTEAFYSHIRAARLGYGRKVLGIDGIANFYAGATVQLLWGVGYFNGRIDNAVYQSTAAFSDLYRADYGNLNIQDPNVQRQLLSSVGQGFGFDLGVSADIGKKLNVGASIVDIGSLLWDQDVVQAQLDVPTLIDSIQEGIISSYNLNTEITDVYDLAVRVPGESFRTYLNTQARLNASYRVSPRFVVAGDLVMPFRNSNLNVIDQEAATLTGSVNWVIVPKMINFSSGFIYNRRVGYRWPAGLTVGLGSFVVSLTTADFLTFVTSRDPMAAVSISVMGFN